MLISFLDQWLIWLLCFWVHNKILFLEHNVWFCIQVDMTKVKLDTIKPWITNRITELLGGLEDDVVVEYVFNQLDADKVNINSSTVPSRLPND